MHTWWILERERERERERDYSISLYSAQIKGLPEALKDPDSLVASNYSPDTVQKTFANMRRFRGGNAIFTFPPMPIKCPGAPQKIMYLADDYWRNVNHRLQYY